MKSWKRAEYYVAERLGGARVPLSGGPGATHSCDVITPTGLRVEVTTDTRRVKEKLLRIVKVCKEKGGIPCVVFRLEGRWYAIVPLSYLKCTLEEVGDDVHTD